MKTLILLSISFTLLFSKVLNIGIVPYKTPKELIKIYQPLINYIEKNSNYKINLHFPKDYSEILTLIKQNRIDIASMTSYLYIKNIPKLKDTRYLASTLRNKNGIITWCYYSYIITREDKNIKSLKDIKNKTFGFTDINSASGFLYPKNMLLKEGIDYKKDLFKYFFLKKHNRVIQALLSGSIDAAAAFDEVVDTEIKKHPNQIKILAKSPPIPLNTFITTKNLSLDEHKILKELLLKYFYLDKSKFIAGFIDIDKKLFKDIEELISFSKN